MITLSNDELEMIICRSAERLKDGIKPAIYGEPFGPHGGPQHRLRVVTLRNVLNIQVEEWLKLNGGLNDGPAPVDRK